MPKNKRTINYFNKWFEFQGNELWYIPVEAYKDHPWHIESFQQMKVELNAVKSLLGAFDLDEWSKYTKTRDPSSAIIQTLKASGNVELVTQAWCKFYECLNQFPVVPESASYTETLSSLHLCEAPGAFISALNRFLYLNYRHVDWKWVASTLNPYYEGNATSDMIADDRLIKCSLQNWDFGADMTGDLMKYYNHEHTVAKGPFMLITADGSVDCMNDPGEQENIVHHLHYCEVMTALRALDVWGNFVLKLFTFFEHGTICLMYLLCCCFMKVHVFKPCSSKSGNSEVYIICLGYKGWSYVATLWPSLIKQYKEPQEKAMFGLHDLNWNFLAQIEYCSKYFKEMQSCTINENVKKFSQNMDNGISQLQTEIADYFLKHFKVALHIPKRYRLISAYEKRQQFQEWEFTTLTWENFPPAQINLKTGKGVEIVVTSPFCQTDLTSFKGFDDTAPLQSFLSSDFRTISHTSFELLPQYKFHRDFYRAITQCDCDILILGVPLLTRCAVGIVYLLASTYESVLVYNKGAIFLHGRNEEQYRFAKNSLAVIEETFNSVETECRFACDILEVFPKEILEKGLFYEAVCTYNNGLFL